MSNLVLRLLSLLFYWQRRLDPVHWFAGLVMAWWGWYQGPVEGNAATYIWWALALVVVIFGQSARWMGYAIFVRSRHESFPEGPHDARLMFRGVVAGPGVSRTRMLGGEGEVHLVNLPVQVRWLDERRVPTLALLYPANLSAEVRFPLDRADAYSTWYSGSDVAEGWVYIAGHAYPGLRISFLGRRLLLGLEREEEAAAVAQVLAQ